MLEKPNIIHGEVLSIRRGVITVRRLSNGEEYTVYVGRRTSYVPRRYPYLGEKVIVTYIVDLGYLKATLVEIQP